jgi:acyl-coenzyme A synthetase/AMP-(fatty) acid ligase
VLDVADIGVPEDMGGRAGVVEPVSWDAATTELAAELVTWARDRSAYKCPRAVDFERRLPRGENGKL